MKSSGDEVIRCRLGQHVARNLLDAELIEGHVSVQRTHDPVAVGPDLPRAVLLKAVRVRIARQVQPAPRPALAILLGGQQVIDEVVIGTGRLVIHKRICLRRGWRQADEIEINAAHERVAIRLRRGLQAFPFQTLLDEGINRMNALLGQWRLLGWYIGPVSLVGRPFRNPRLQNVFRTFRQHGLRMRRRHDLILIGRKNAFDDFALVRLAGYDGHLA